MTRSAQRWKNLIKWQNLTLLRKINWKIRTFMQYLISRPKTWEKSSIMQIGALVRTTRMLKSWELRRKTRWFSTRRSVKSSTNLSMTISLGLWFKLWAVFLCQLRWTQISALELWSSSSTTRYPTTSWCTWVSTFPKLTAATQLGPSSGRLLSPFIRRTRSTGVPTWAKQRIGSSSPSSTSASSPRPKMRGSVCRSPVPRRRPPSYAASNRNFAVKSTSWASIRERRWRSINFTRFSSEWIPSSFNRPNISNR